MAPNKEVTQKALVTEPEAKAPPSVQPGGFKFGQGSLLKPSQTTASGKTVADTSSLLTTAVKVQQEDVANKGDSMAPRSRRNVVYKKLSSFEYK